MLALVAEGPARLRRGPASRRLPVPVPHLPTSTPGPDLIPASSDRPPPMTAPFLILFTLLLAFVLSRIAAPRPHLTTAVMPSPDPLPREELRESGEGFAFEWRTPVFGVWSLASAFPQPGSGCGGATQSRRPGVRNDSRLHARQNRQNRSNSTRRIAHDRRREIHENRLSGSFVHHFAVAPRFRSAHSSDNSNVQPERAPALSANGFGRTSSAGPPVLLFWVRSYRRSVRGRTATLAAHGLNGSSNGKSENRSLTPEQMGSVVQPENDRAFFASSNKLQLRTYAVRGIPVRSSNGKFERADGNPLPPRSSNGFGRTGSETRRRISLGFARTGMGASSAAHRWVRLDRVPHPIPLLGWVRSYRGFASAPVLLGFARTALEPLITSTPSTRSIGSIPSIG